jgi:hypothetical protein
MTDSVYAPPKSDLSSPVADSSEAFYVVSLMKMMVLFLATMGMYQLYWHYKNWRLHQQMSASHGGPDGDVWPVPRAIFAMFFIHSLLGKVKQHAIAQQRPGDLNTTLIATLIVVLMLFGYLGLFVTDPKVVLLFSVVSMCLVVASMFLYRKAQRFINESCGDPTGASNAEFTTANYIWIVIGILIWIMQVVGLVMIASTVE